MMAANDFFQLIDTVSAIHFCRIIAACAMPRWRLMSDHFVH
jgi:hypothetical protein